VFLRHKNRCAQSAVADQHRIGLQLSEIVCHCFQRHNNKGFAMTTKPKRASAMKKKTLPQSVRGIRALQNALTELVAGFPAANQVELAKQGGRWMAGDLAKKIKTRAVPAKQATTKRTAPKSTRAAGKTLTRGQKAAATRKANAAAKAAGSTTQETTAELH
jgi:hypothetical protein